MKQYYFIFNTYLIKLYQAVYAFIIITIFCHYEVFSYDFIFIQGLILFLAFHYYSLLTNFKYIILSARTTIKIILKLYSLTSVFNIILQVTRPESLVEVSNNIFSNHKTQREKLNIMIESQLNLKYVQTHY